MATRKSMNLPQFKYATIADLDGTLLWPERIELCWGLDESVSFTLPERCVVRAGDELWLTYESSERLVRVVSVEPRESGKNEVTAKPANLHGSLYFRKK